MLKALDELHRFLWMDKTVQLSASFRESMKPEMILKKNDPESVEKQYRILQIHDEQTEYDGCANTAWPQIK